MARPRNRYITRFKVRVQFRPKQAATKEPDVDYTRLSDIDLLRRVVGPRVAERIYKGALAPLFSPEPKPGGHAKLLAARELIRRMLAEEMRRDNVLTSPSAVRDYLRLLFRAGDTKVSP